MKKAISRAFKTFFSIKKSIRVLYIILTVIAVYYSVITSIFLLFLLPLIVMWLVGAEGVEFFNVSSSQEIQRRDISFFTSRDILDSVELLSIIGILVFTIVMLRKLEKRLP
jgi:hypothetical protein